MNKRIKLLVAFAMFLFLPYQTTLARERYFPPDFTLKDLNQNPVSLNEFKDKKSVLLFFWTTWCPYCVRQLRVISEQSQQIKQDNLEVLAINVGEGLERVARFVKRNYFSFRVLLDEDTVVAESYEIFGVPTYILVDKYGKVRYEGNVFPAYKRLLKE